LHARKQTNTHSKQQKQKTTNQSTKQQANSKQAGKQIKSNPNKTATWEDLKETVGKI